MATAVETKNPYQRLFLGMTGVILLPFFISAPLMIGALLYLMVKERRRLVMAVKGLGPFLIFIGYTALVAVANRNWAGLAVSFALAGFSFFFYFYQIYVAPKTYEAILKVIVIGAALIALVTLASYLHYVHLHETGLLYILRSESPQWRGEGTFFNANYYGMFCIFAIIIDMWLLKKTSSQWWKMGCLLSLLLCIVGIVLTAARMIIPTAMLAVLVMLYFLYPRSFKLAMLVIGVGIVAVWYYPQLIPRVTSLFSSLAKRESLWRGGWSIFMSHPLTGRGPMAYLNYYYLYQTEPQLHSHQILIDSLANYGLIGLLLLVNAFGPYLRKRMEMWRNRPAFAVFFAIVLTIAVHGLVDVSIFWLQTGYICVCILAVDADYLG